MDINLIVYWIHFGYFDGIQHRRLQFSPPHFSPLFLDSGGKKTEKTQVDHTNFCTTPLVNQKIPLSHGATKNCTKKLGTIANISVLWYV